jgi:uncharacterized protein (TIGR02246 family)
MRKRRTSFLVLATALAVLAARPVSGREGEGDPKDKDAIAKNADAFIEAFQQGDAKTLAGLWTPDGDYTGMTGRRTKGRQAIEKALAAFFAENKGLKARIESESLRFVTPEVAIEDGTSFTIPPDGSPPSRARYTIVHVKKDGNWYLSSVREAPYSPPSNYEHLRPLEWLVGTWAAENDKGDAQHLTVSWTDNQNFLVGTFATDVRGVSVGRATHWIAWDPVEKRIRSWIFDAAGGFGEAAWTGEGDKWVLKAKTTLQNGKKATATFHLGRGDGGILTLQATDRTVDGKPVPDTPEYKLKRVK